MTCLMVKVAVFSVSLDEESTVKYLRVRGSPGFVERSSASQSLMMISFGEMFSGRKLADSPETAVIIE